MSDYNVNEQDKNRAQSIRRQYVSREENKMAQLRRLDSKVKLPGKIAAGILGVIGVLVMGAGMSQIMVWENMTMGLGLSIPGMVAALAAYPVYAAVTGRRKKKYADQIIQLSDDLINE